MAAGMPVYRTEAVHSINKEAQKEGLSSKATSAHAFSRLVKTFASNNPIQSEEDLNRTEGGKWLEAVGQHTRLVPPKITALVGSNSFILGLT